MAVIVDPDSLNQGVEITINTTTRKITLNEAGNLSSDGVTLQALYSFLKEEWKNDALLIPFPFPMIAITPEQFEFVYDWEPVGDTTPIDIDDDGSEESSSFDSIAALLLRRNRADEGVKQPSPPRVRGKKDDVVKALIAESKSLPTQRLSDIDVDTIIEQTLKTVPEEKTEDKPSRTLSQKDLKIQAILKSQSH